VEPPAAAISGSRRGLWRRTRPNISWAPMPPNHRSVAQGGGEGPMRAGRNGARNARMGMRKRRGVANKVGCVHGSCVSTQAQGRCRHSGHVVEEEQGNTIERG